MDQPLVEPTVSSAGQSGSGRLKRLRLRQMRRDALVRAAEAQENAARAAERIGFYIIWSVILAGISATITAIAVYYTAVADLSYVAAW